MTSSSLRSDMARSEPCGNLENQPAKRFRLHYRQKGDIVHGRTRAAEKYEDISQGFTRYLPEFWLMQALGSFRAGASGGTTLGGLDDGENHSCRR